MQDEPASSESSWTDEGDWNGLAGSSLEMAHRCGQKCQIGPDGNFTGAEGVSQAVAGKL